MSGLVEYKCPACGGAMEFDSALQKMKCPYCDTTMTVEEFEAMLHGEETETVDSSSIAQEQEIIESAIIDTEENVATMEEI